MGKTSDICYSVSDGGNIDYVEFDEMKTVYVCSPFSPTVRYSVYDNVKYAALCCRFVLKNGNAPFAPHLMYPWCLRDNEQSHRNLACAAGIEYLKKCDEVWCFIRNQLDIKSEGMKSEISEAVKNGIPVFDVFLPDDVEIGTSLEVIMVHGGRSTKIPWIVPSVPMFDDAFKRK